MPRRPAAKSGSRAWSGAARRRPATARAQARSATPTARLTIGCLLLTLLTPPVLLALGLLLGWSRLAWP